MAYQAASWSFGGLPRTRRRSPTPDSQRHALRRTQSSAPYPQQLSNTMQHPSIHPQLRTSNNMQCSAYPHQCVPDSTESSPEYPQQQVSSTMQSSPRHSQLHASNSMQHPIAYSHQPAMETTDSLSGHIHQNMGTPNEFNSGRNHGSPFRHHSPQASPPPESVIIGGIKYIAAPQQLPNAPHPPSVPQMQSHTPNGWSGHYGPNGLMHAVHPDSQRGVSVSGTHQGSSIQRLSPERQRRYQSVAPDIRRAQYDETYHISSQSPPSRHEVRGPQLGSPIWSDVRLQEGRARHADAPEKIRRGPAQVHGRVSYQYDSSLRYASPRDDAPQTPPQQRARSRNRPRQASPDQRGRRRSKSTAPQARVPALENLRTPVQYKSPTVEEHCDVEDYTPLNKVLRKQQVRGQMSRKNVAQNGYNAVNILPKQSVFRNKFQKTNSPSYQQNPMQTIFNAPRFQEKGSPEVINLCTPSTIAGTPAKAHSPPRPMRERITPAQKPILKRPPVTAPDITASPSKPKKQKVVEKEPEKVDPEAAKQRRAAEIIVNMEMKGAEEASDLAIFGELVGETEEEKKRKVEEEAAKQRRENHAKLAILKAKEEAKEQAEREKQRALAEAEERTRLEKEQEEERKKAQREAKRKLQEAEEERIREEKRKIAAESIEAQRQKAAEEAQRLEEEKQVKEKTSGVQVDPEEIAKLKAKQEEAKKQAASLSSAKPTANKDTASGSNEDVDIEDENSLFVPDGAPTPKQPSNRRSSSIGPRRSKLQQDRDARERQRLEQDTRDWRAKITSMWEKRKLSRLAMPEEPPLPQPESSRERPKPRPRLDRVLKKGRAPPKSRSKAKAASVPASENGSELDVSLVGTISASLFGVHNLDAGTRARNTSQVVTGIITPETSFDSIASEPAKFPPPLAPPVLKSRVVTVSDQIEKLRFEREEHEKAKKRNERNKKSRETARLKRTEQARGKKRLELSAEAEKNNIELTEENLNAQVEAYMEKRENEQQKRRQSIARTEAIRNMAPDALSLNLTNKFILDDLNSNSDDEITFNQNLKKKPIELELIPEDEDEFTRATRESIAALQRERGGSFRAAAAKRTVADFQTDSSDSESEEDPDAGPAPKPSKTHDRGSTDGENCDSDAGSETETGEGVPATNGITPDKHDNETTAPLQATNSSSQKQPSAAKKHSTLQTQPRISTTDFNDRLVWIYSVIQAETINGVSGPTLKGSDFLDCADAIRHASHRLQTYRSTRRTIHSVEETYNDSDIYLGKLIFNEERSNHLTISINKFPQAPQEIVDFDASKVPERVPIKTYILKLKTHRREVTRNGMQVEIRDCDVVDGRMFSELEMANTAACSYLIEYIKPTAPRLDDIEQHANVAAPRIRERRDKHNEEKTRFVCGMEPEKGELEWMMPLSFIEVGVVLFKMEGPVN